MLLFDPAQACPDNHWTVWFDRDDPSHRCDCETLNDLKKENPGKICETPTGIAARLISTKQLYKSKLRNIRISPTYGFACWNNKDHVCKDYEVRFCCPTAGTSGHLSDRLPILCASISANVFSI